MNIRIKVKSGSVTSVEIAPSTKDECQVLDYDMKQMGDGWVDFVDVKVVNEIDFGNPPEETGGE